MNSFMAALYIGLAALALFAGCGPHASAHVDGGTSNEDDPDDPGSPDPGECDDDDRSYIGCSYWAVDLDNAMGVKGGTPAPGGDCAAYGPAVVYLPAWPVCVDAADQIIGTCQYGGDCSSFAQAVGCVVRDVCANDAQHAPYAIVVGNPSSRNPADVTVEDAEGHSHTATLAPGEVLALLPQDLGFPDRSLDHTGITASAYHVTSTRPIVAYQFNPLDDVGVFSNDGSLLLPEQTLGNEHYAVTLATYEVPDTAVWNGALSVAAVTGPTEVTVTPTGAIRAGDGIAAIAAGEPRTFTLQAFDVLNLEAIRDADLTGSWITSDRPVAVFGAHEAAALKDPNPFSSGCCADHLEDQLLPSHAWGQRYAVGQLRDVPFSDYVRVIARRPGTAVSIEQGAGRPPTQCFLEAGEWCDAFFKEGGADVRSNQPILVMHFMTSIGGVSPNSGDPAMALVVPVEQFRSDYTLLVPEQFAANQLSIVAPMAGQVMVDGDDVSVALAPFASGEYGRVRVPVAAGPHRVDCPGGCSVEVSGWDVEVSYLYPGGLDVREIVE